MRTRRKCHSRWQRKSPQDAAMAEKTDRARRIPRTTQIALAIALSNQSLASATSDERHDVGKVLLGEDFLQPLWHQRFRRAVHLVDLAP